MTSQTHLFQEPTAKPARPPTRKTCANIGEATAYAHGLLCSEVWSDIIIIPPTHEGQVERIVQAVRL